MSFPNLANESPLDVLRLIRSQNVGPITFFQLMRRFGNAEGALSALPDLSARGGRKTPLTAYGRAEAMKEIEACEKFGARMILYGAPEYPKLLLSIADPPPIITVFGKALWNEKKSIAMVGARNASAAGCQFAQKLAKDLGEHGFIVASGLARGIDTFVHKGALAGGTVAVIAGGIDNIYPPENAILYEQIKENGAIVSEQPFGAIPFSGAFPGRNRIIAGMSVGTVVVEASPKSGSLITARFALESNREVFAVPGSPLDPRSRGCNQLIKDGADMVENVTDILQGLAHLRNLAMETPPAAYIPQTPAPDESELASARAKILGKLSLTAVSVDELIEQCGISASAALTVLLELELAGRIRRSAGNKVALIGDLGENVA